MLRAICSLAVGAVCCWAVVASAATPPTSQVVQAMQMKFPRVSFTNYPLGKALESIARTANVKIEPQWSAMRAANATPDSTVNVHGENLTLAQVMDLTLGRVDGVTAPLSWMAEGDVLRVTTQIGVMQPAALPAVPQTMPAAAQDSALAKVNFEQVNLEDAIGFLRQAMRVNIFVNWRALQAVGIERTAPVNVQVENVPFSRVLDLVLDSVNAGHDKLQSAYWVLEEGVITISSGADLDQQMRVRTLDVTDLLMAIPDFPGPRVDSVASSNGNGNAVGGQTNSAAGGSNGAPQPGANEATRASDTAGLKTQQQADLVAVIQSTTGTDLWEPVGKGSIRFVGGQMIVSQSVLGFKLMDKALSKLRP